MKATTALNCSFCDKTDKQVSKLIMQAKGAICNNCVAHCVEIMLTDSLGDPEDAEDINFDGATTNKETP